MSRRRQNANFAIVFVTRVVKLSRPDAQLKDLSEQEIYGGEHLESDEKYQMGNVFTMESLSLLLSKT